MKKVESVKPVFSGIAHGLPRQRGASLLEGIAYLGIAAIVVLGAVSLLTNAFGSAKANQTTEEIIALRTVVRKLYAGQPYNVGNMAANLINANAIPNTLVVVGGPTNIVNNSWAGAVTIAGASAGTFTISYAGVPRDVCMSVVSGANGWTQVSDGTTNVTVFPVTATAAATICVNPTNTITFTAT